MEYLFKMESRADSMHISVGYDSNSIIKIDVVMRHSELKCVWFRVFVLF